MSKSKHPKCKSYKIVCDAVDNQLTCAKLYFFSFVASFSFSLIAMLLSVLKELKLNESSNLLNNKDLNAGFGTKKMLLDLQKKYLITVKENSQLLKDSKHLL